MLAFLLWSLVYPANLYLFSRFSREKDEKIKTKVLSTAASCALLSWYLAFRFSFEWNWRLLLLFFSASLPFLSSLQIRRFEDDWWRDFIAAPAIEEFYYRCLIPQLQPNILLASLSFSLAHGHSLLFDRSKADEVVGTCLISFAFGLVANWIRVKSEVESDSVWFWLSASNLHGLANYVGVPVQSRLSIFITLLSIVLLVLL